MIRGLALILCCAASAVGAVQPDEILDDPALEERARDISSGLRCLVCRNESIDESDAELARDLRVLVRDRLVAGDSDAAAVQFIVDRYGEYVLLTPLANGSNLVLWLAGPGMLELAGGLGFVYIRRRANSKTAEDDTLNDAEQARLREILDK